MSTQILQGLDETSDVALHALGETCNVDGNTYIYLQGVASTAVGSWVTYYPLTFTTALLTKTEADKLYPVAIAMSANVANKYGWYLVQGTADGAVLASCAKEVAIYTSATGGSVDDTTTSQTKINRAVCLETDAGSGGNVAVQISYPSAG